jgi:hypothetical protein
MGDPTGKAEEAPRRTAESKFLSLQGTDNIYNQKQHLCEIKRKTG